jgi:hypothetical protein
MEVGDVVVISWADEMAIVANRRSIFDMKADFMVNTGSVLIVLLSSSAIDSQHKARCETIATPSSELLELRKRNRNR